MGNLAKAVGPMVKVRHTCLSFVLCLITPLSMLEDTLFNFNEIPRYNCNLSPMLSIRPQKFADWCISAEVNLECMF